MTPKDQALSEAKREIAEGPCPFCGEGDVYVGPLKDYDPTESIRESSEWIKKIAESGGPVGCKWEGK